MDAVLNWLWQGGLVALFAMALLRLVDPSRAGARVQALWVALLSVLLLPAVAMIWEVAGAEQAAVDRFTPSGVLVSIPGGWWSSGALLAGLWAAWSAAYAGKIVLAIVRVRTAIDGCEPCPVAVEARLLHWMQVRGEGRRTRLVLSRQLRSAAVFGCGSPVIAVSPDLVDSLTDEDLDRVVLHEWAHVQRRDDLTNALLLLVRLVAGWHPAVIWIDRQLQVEREVAADEMAVAVTGSAKRYASCLVKLATLPAGPVPAVGVPASSRLRRRVVRILSPRHHALAPWRRAAMVGALILPGVIALVVGPFRLFDATSLVTTITTKAEAALHAGISPTDGEPLAMARTPPLRQSVSRRRQPVLPSVSAAQPALDHLMAPTVVSSPQSAGDPAVPTEPDTSATAGSAASVQAVAQLEPQTPKAGTSTAPAQVAASSTEKPEPGSPWSAAADAGVAVGRESQKAAVATAGFFTRMSKRIAGSF